MQQIPLQSKLSTDSEDITYTVSDEPRFNKKSALFWNGTLRNTRCKSATGFPTTSGKTLKYEAYDEGVQLTTEDGKEILMPYTSVLSNYYKIENKAAGKQIAHAYWNERIFTLYKNNQQEYTVVATDENDVELGFKKLPENSTAMFTSVYNLDEEPLIFINQKTKYSVTNYDNEVNVYPVSEWFDFVSEPKYRYVLDSSKLLDVQIKQSKYEESVENTENAARLYDLAYEQYVRTGKGLENVQEAYSTFLTQEMKMNDAKKTYLTALYDYNPEEEIDYCKEEIDRLNSLLKTLELEKTEIEADNETALERKSTLETNISNLEKRIASEENDLYNSKAPELSAEAKAIKNKADAELAEVKSDYDKVYSDYYKEVVTYLNYLKKYELEINWRYAYTSTSYRSCSYKISGDKIYSALPQSVDTVGRYIAQGVDLEFSANSIGTTGGYAVVDQNKVRVGHNNMSQGVTYTTNNATIYLSQYRSQKYGFNYNAIQNYADVVRKYNLLAAAEIVYNQALEKHNEVMSSNPELINYQSFINNYNIQKALIEEDKENLATVQGQLNALLNELDDILKSLELKQVKIDYCIKQLDELNKELKRAQAYLSTFRKVEEIDSDGNVVYTSLESIFNWKSSEGVPLGDANSGTTFRDDDGYKWIVIGFDDDDKNRSIVLYWSEKDKVVTELKWYGVVDVKGLVTGEPLPDPDIFTERTRQSNGTYRWDMQVNGNTRIAGQIIGGWSFSTTNRAYEKIIVETWENNQSVRVNLSANDTLTETEQKEGKADPIRYFVTNFADSKGIYYDYGPGWIKTYVRKINPNNRQILDCYIYTYGMVSQNNLPYQKESVMAKGKTKVWTYKADNLNKRIYTVGGTNKADDSLLTTLPFSVNILPEETDSRTSGHLPTLRAQIYGLSTLSFSYNKSLVSNGEEHGSYQVTTSADGKTIILSVNSMVYIIKKTSDFSEFRIWKVADYYFQTNILSDDNTIIEDRNGNINVERGNIPYAEECMLDIEDLNLTIPPEEQLVTNDTWFWAAAYNPFFLNGVNSSYILPAISIPLYIDSAQLETFQTEALEQRGSILKPMLKGLFDEYEKVDIFYTVATVTSTLYYKTSNVVKVSDIDEDQYDIFGKETFEVDLNGTTYSVSSTTQFFPLGVGSVLHGVNYITPTIELEDEYAVRLYTNSNRVYGGYQYASRIYNGTNVFTIYGRNYYYDRQGIYFIGTSSTYTANQFVCYALGMKYLANSGSEAYFYSPFDKTVYIFTGSNTLQRMTSLSSKGNITDSLFSSQEQILYLLTDENTLLMLKEDDLAEIENIIENGHLEGTELGCAVLNKTEYQLYSPYKQLDDLLPLKLSTVFMGSDTGLTKLSHFDYLVYKVNDYTKPVTFNLNVTSLNGIERKTEKKEIVVKPDMWKGRTYRIRYSPQNNVANSFQVGISSDDDVAISFHGWEASPYGNTAAPQR